MQSKEEKEIKKAQVVCICPDCIPQEVQQKQNISKFSAKEAKLDKPQQKQNWEEIRKEFIGWYRQMLNQDPEFPTNFDIADWWLNKLSLSRSTFLEEVRESINKLQKYTGGSSVEPKDIRVKLQDILSTLATMK
jgi:hypothetical protein